MKKISLILLLAVICFAANAQYKKASFLTKGGRTYELGGQAHILTAAHTVMPSFNFAYGRDKGGKRIFHWFDLELLLPTKFHYSTTDNVSKAPVTVYSQTGLTLNYRYNFAYYVVHNDNEEGKVFPFLTVGIGGAIAGDYTFKGMYTIPANASISKDPASLANIAANGGAGVIIKSNDWLAFKAVAGYAATYMAEEDPNLFYPYKSHPYISIGVRFMVKGSGD